MPNTASTFASVLVPLDGSDLSEHSLPYVQAVADPTSRITLFQAIAPVHDYLPPTIPGDIGLGPEQERDWAEEAERELNERADKLAANAALPVRPEVQVGFGDPAQAILDASIEIPADLIVMTTRGQNLVERALFGSVTDRIVRASNVPVLVVRPEDEVAIGHPAAINRIVVPLDGSRRAEHAIPLATELAKQRGLPLLLVRAITYPAISGWPAGIPQETYDLIESEAQDYLSAVREKLASDLPYVSAITRWGVPFDIIDTTAKAHDLIVITSHGRTGFRRWLLGSVAEKVLRSGAAPVLLVPVRDHSRDEQEEGLHPAI